MKKLVNLGIATIALGGLSACGDATAPEGDAYGEASKWGYGDEDGPAVWGDLSEDYVLCKTGKEQSPIDLPIASEANTITVSGTYGAATAEIIDNGHTVQANFGEGMTLTSGDSTYGLLQFHLHTPSENTIAGQAFPLVAHLVHADADGNLAVLGVMFEDGEASAPLQAVLDNIGGGTDVDVAAMLPGDMTVYNFAGSLTTPPCSEGVNWHVLTTPVSASGEQIAALTETMGNNARPVQPLNDRAIGGPGE